jgi:hypothetical protein
MSTSWEVEYTDQFETWWATLPLEQQRHIAQGVELLAEYGPSLGRPLVDTVTMSRHANMKELRADTTRTLFAFDPRRSAIGDLALRRRQVREVECVVRQSHPHRR